MPDSLKVKEKACIRWVLALSLLLIFLTGCKDRDKVFTVGIAVHASVHLPVIEGFKAGMTELGYFEGKDIRYIYHGILRDDEKYFDAEIQRLLSQGADLLLTTGSSVSLRAKKAVEGTDVAVVFCANVQPVEFGLVKSISSPGGNLTGVQVADTMPKLIELLVLIKPDIKKIYMPLNPEDIILTTDIELLKKNAAQMNVDFVTQEVHSVEEAVAAIESLPEDIGAIYRAPSPSLDPRNDELGQAAIRQGLPMGAVLPLDESVLITLASDFYEIGRQAARQVHQICQGISPSDLPVETAEAFLTINLDTAKKIGIEIPDDILLQANKIIR